MSGYYPAVSVDERLEISSAQLTDIETQLRLERHVNRYRAARAYAVGYVLDFGCGSGYGSKLLSRGADVLGVTGVDIHLPSICYANIEYAEDDVDLEFVPELEDPQRSDFQSIVAIEVLEHLEDQELIDFVALVLQVQPDPLTLIRIMFEISHGTTQRLCFRTTVQKSVYRCTTVT
jgi:2-polyprenyl-3-methyl-5-hydroxy-6-metoxy-1,4-benzoquinol methylase